MPIKLPPYPDPEQFKQFSALVKRARNHQRGSITQRQFHKLLNIIMSAQERTSPLFGWYYGNRHFLTLALHKAGIAIRKDKFPNPGRFKTKERGFGRIVEIEQKIEKRKKRKRRKLIRAPRKHRLTGFARLVQVEQRIRRNIAREKDKGVGQFYFSLK